MKRFFWLLAILCAFSPLLTYQASEVIYPESSAAIESNEAAEHPTEPAHAEYVSEESHSSGHRGPDTAPLFFIIVAIFIGAATRHFLKKIPVPFTALLLIIGIILGVLTRIGAFESWGGLDVSFIADAFHFAAHIDPHMLFFVFLPVLIFEAAFAMDLHTFKKSATNSVILAVPGILAALLLTGAMVYAIDFFDIGLEGWANWSLAFMFGSVISATDPVAVVALLKDLGASKKLGTLIEGESLLNDGTAIVLFMVFFLGISGQASDTNGFVEFLRVSLGGIGVGLFIGWIVLRWIKGVYNDAMVEISVVVAAAFITFYIAEHFLHVSGVLALVALGLLIGGFGRSSISPQVEHFMHEFWELAGFVANCLIFLIVGIVVAQRTQFSANDFLVLAIVYIGIHVVRALVMLMLYPFMRNSGYGLPVKDAIVVWFGALRGAIGLALALIVAGVDSETMAVSLDMTPAEAQTIKDQFLFLIAGTVTLTLLVNATTIKFLVKRLGLLDLAPAKAIMLRSASEYMRTSAENHMQKLKGDRHLRRANWSAVAEYLPDEIAMLDEIDTSGLELAKMAEHRRRILEKEKSSYWKQFKDGILGADSVRALSETVDEILDDAGAKSLSNRQDLELLWTPPKWMSTVQSVPLIGQFIENSFFERLAVSYDSAAGFVYAQEECLKMLESMFRSEPKEEHPNLDKIQQEVNENIISGQTFMRNLRNTYPEIYRAIATRQAIRSVLNYELHTVERLRGKGRLDGGEASKLTHNIEARMKALLEKPPSVEAPETADLIQSIHWLAELEKGTQTEIGRLCQTRIFAKGQTLSKPGSAQGIYIIARGSVKVMHGDETTAVLSKGDIIGEVSFLTNTRSTARVVAETPVTALTLNQNHANQVCDESSDFKNSLWSLAGKRIAANVMSKMPNHQGEDSKVLRREVAKGNMRVFKAGESSKIEPNNLVVLIAGKAHDSTNKALTFSAQSQISATEVVFEEESHVWVVPM